MHPRTNAVLIIETAPLLPILVRTRPLVESALSRMIRPRMSAVLMIATLLLLPILLQIVPFEGLAVGRVAAGRADGIGPAAGLVVEFPAILAVLTLIPAGARAALLYAFVPASENVPDELPRSTGALASFGHRLLFPLETTISAPVEAERLKLDVVRPLLLLLVETSDDPGILQQQQFAVGLRATVLLG